jgi:hypothetical protein
VTRPAEHFKDLVPPAGFADDAVIEDLGDGLVLRHATGDDIECLADFNQTVHADPPVYAPHEGVAAWTRDLMSGDHPRVGARDFLLVDDTKEKRVASTLVLVSHRFRYGEVEFEGGQPEMVGSHPDYRRRGLVRRLFDATHRQAAEQGQRMLIIDGIPWYYRQFGYDMALEQGFVRLVDASLLPGGEPDPAAKLRLREAAEDDIPFLAELYARTCQRHRISCARSPEQWRYELSRCSPRSHTYRVFKIAERSDGTAVAAWAQEDRLELGFLVANFVEVAPGEPWQEIRGPLLAELRRQGEHCAERDGQKLLGAALALGREHPFYEVARSVLRVRPGSYAFYVRIEDLVGFLEHVAPELEQRLAASAFSGQHGVLDLNLFRQGVRLRFEQGRIAGVEAWKPDTEARGHVSFPGLSFLQLLMGYRSLGELEEFYPDCMILHPERGALVEALFPTGQSNLWATY